MAKHGRNSPKNAQNTLKIAKKGANCPKSMIWSMVGTDWSDRKNGRTSMIPDLWSDKKYGRTTLLDQMVRPEVWLDQTYGRTRSMVSVMVGRWTRSEVGPEVWSDQKYGQRYGWTRWSDQKCGRTRSMVGPDLWSDQKYGWNRFIAPEKNMVGPLWRNHNYGQIWFNQGCLHNGRFFNYILCPKMFASPSLTIVGPIFFKFV